MNRKSFRRATQAASVGSAAGLVAVVASVLWPPSILIAVAAVPVTANSIRRQKRALSAATV